ncbi:MAG: hypothetical protein AAGJ82_03750, partial [Bacteroidota bacterium]
MNKLFLALLTWAVSTTLLLAQYTTVKYDALSNWFNQGQPLPAEVDMVFTGVVSDDIQVVELNFLDTKHQDVLYTAQWQRTGTETEFVIPVSHKLRAEHNYDLRISYYTSLSETERQALQTKILNSMDVVLAAQQKQKIDIDFRRSHRKIVGDMNDILAEQLRPYRSTLATWTPELSELVELQLEQIESADLERFYDKKDTTQTRQNVREQARTKQLDAFRSLLEQETSTLLAVPLYRLVRAREVKDYRTERKPGVLSVNLGYAGVYLSGDWADGQYAAAPYAGIAIPLGNRVLGTKFLRNTAINVGVFLTDLDTGKEKAVEGFLIDQPLYVGLDYRLFQFIHFNAGTTLLNGNTIDGEPNLAGDQKLTFRPF